MAEWVIATMTSLGYLGIGLLMFLENLFPPIPSELIMPLAGFTVAQGKMNMAYAVLAGVVGTMLGAVPWYYLGAALSAERLERLAERYGKWLGISGEDISKSKLWFDRHGGKAVLFCRLVPGVRTLISLPAGIHNMDWIPFLVYSTIGTTIWCLFLTYAGYLLGRNYELIENYLGPVSKYVLGGLVVAFLVWLFFHNRAKRAAKISSGEDLK